MQLYISPTSPYARKARIVVLEKGLADEVRIIPINPWEDPSELRAVNPLGQVPVLVTDDQTVLFDSRVICQFLVMANNNPPLPGQEGWERINVLRWEALADGMTDAAVNAFLGRKSNGGEPDTPAIKRQLDKIRAALEVMQDGLPDLERPLNLGTIACGTALGYLDLRFSDLSWREQVPRLGEWFDEYAKRPAMVETKPVP